jgi:hypothetical protein
MRGIGRVKARFHGGVLPLDGVGNSLAKLIVDLGHRHQLHHLADYLGGVHAGGGQKSLIAVGHAHRDLIAVGIEGHVHRRRGGVVRDVAAVVELRRHQQSARR